MTPKIIVKCPLGKECEEIVGDEIHRCAWYSEVEGQNPVNGEQIRERRCDINWLVMIGIENNKRMTGTAVATESLRNVLVSAAHEHAIKKQKKTGLLGWLK